MAVPYLNNVPTQDGYVDALTVQFGRPRQGFALQLFNAAIFYQLFSVDPAFPGGLQIDSAEHYLAPSLASFNDPVTDGLPPGTFYAGVRVRSAVAGVPGNVSVA